jgi:hypothetical protein
MYFGAVNANPVDARTVVGLFPTTVASKRKNGKEKAGNSHAAILAALSCDGVHFSTPVELLPAKSGGRGEVNDHPVDGFVRRGGDIYAYAHHGVPGTLANYCDISQKSVDPPPSTLVRYTIPADRPRAAPRTRGSHRKAAETRSANDGSRGTASFAAARGTPRLRKWTQKQMQQLREAQLCDLPELAQNKSRAG